MTHFLQPRRSSRRAPPDDGGAGAARVAPGPGAVPVGLHRGAAVPVLHLRPAAGPHGRPAPAGALGAAPLIGFATSASSMDGQASSCLFGQCLSDTRWSPDLAKHLDPAPSSWRSAWLPPGSYVTGVRSRDCGLACAGHVRSARDQRHRRAHQPEDSLDPDTARCQGQSAMGARSGPSSLRHCLNTQPEAGHVDARAFGPVDPVRACRHHVVVRKPSR